MLSIWGSELFAMAAYLFEVLIGDLSMFELLELLMLL